MQPNQTSDAWLYLSDDGISGGDSNLDGALSHWQEEVLNSLLYRWLHILLQLRVLLEQTNL